MNQLEVIKKEIFPQLRALCPTENEAKSIYATVIRLASNPKITACDPQSVIQAFTKAADLGVKLDPAYGECDFLPYKGQLTLQLRAKGYAALAEREGGWEIQTILVFDCDEYRSEQTYANGWFDEKINFVPNLSEREANAHDENWVFEHLRFVIANARRTLSNGKIETASKTLTKGLIEHRRINFSQSQKLTDWIKGNDRERLDKFLPISIWREHYSAMATKTALGTIGKILSKTDKMLAATEYLKEPYDKQDHDASILGVEPEKKARKKSMITIVDDGLKGVIDKETGEIINGQHETPEPDGDVEW